MRKYIVSAAAIILMIGLLFQALPGLAQEPQRQEAPRLAAPVKSPPIINGHGTGFVPPPMDLSHLTGQRMPSEGVSTATVLEPPASFDWRAQGKVTPVGDQGDCGACYAFASIGNIESKLLIDGAGTYNFSENNAKECNWYETANINGGTSCSGGSYLMLASLFSKKGLVLESCDPYVDSDVSCKGTCPYQITLLDWELICGGVVPNTDVLKTYIQSYGPVYTSMYASFPDFVDTYDGSYTLYYTGTEDTDHAVLIVGWDDSLVHAGGSGGWIVKNSWGTEWGGTCGYGSEKGYFTIAYGSANIGMFSSFMYDWQDYDSSGSIMYYDEGGWSGMVGYGSTTAWGLSKFIPASNTYVTRVEFWTTDITTDIDVYIYDDFDGTNLSNLLAQKLNNSFNEAGYHSVALDSPLAVTSGDDVIAVVKFTNSSFKYPLAFDDQGPHETQRTYSSSNGIKWEDEGQYQDDLAIRLRTSTLTPSPPSVTTNNATNKTTSSATLHGNLSSKGTAPTVYVSFQWGTTTAYGEETTAVAKTTTGPFSSPLGGLLPNTTYHFRGKAVGNGTSYGSDRSFTTLTEPNGATATAARHLPAGVEPGTNFDVGITASGYGGFGQIIETLPAGFTYVGVTGLEDFQVSVADQVVRFSLLGETAFSYTVMAPPTATVGTFSGILKDSDLNEYVIGGDTELTVGWDPWAYDEDGSGAIEKDEAVAAVNDYFLGQITKAQVVEVIVLYFGQ